jgi:hypothetical protein
MSDCTQEWLVHEEAAAALFDHEASHGYPDPGVDLLERVEEVVSLLRQLQEGCEQPLVIGTILRLRAQHLQRYAQDYPEEVHLLSTREDLHRFVGDDLEPLLRRAG